MLVGVKLLVKEAGLTEHNH